jgi:hypothetical protein
LNEVLAVKDGVVYEPEVPATPPLGEIQEVLFVEVHISVEVPLLEIVEGVAVRVTAGAIAPADTETVVFWLIVPPGPVHDTE